MRSSNGQAITEFIIIMPVFFALLFGIFEFTYIYRAKATLNTATFDAARAGALNHARSSEMRESLAKNMTPLYVRGNSSIAGLGRAYASARAVEVGINRIRRSVEIIHPTRDMFNKFKVKRLIRFNHQSRPREQWFIPNDHLLTRSTQTEELSGGGRKEISVQDANLLKIKTYWCYEMKVPIIKNLIQCVVNGGWCFERRTPWFQPSREQMACNALGVATGGNYLALSSHAVVRMQSPIIQW
ncbi:TadE/TadG family type IV pilus assembly protein [Pleionea sp. CnH1-48]|uniref:TadE/TadG family type IV pilus assembly protein n=1 Tax=Pleionea sp. CnH1-48 TaxID=2954494 RepID=UPI0020978F2B|nr:TadE/TadG family type IV pilus assembly protein [Pleionea sp. CnH1-48]MCO7223833.1 pilus assembly protein [Pleionea sp. CnH1-48]